MQGRWSEERWMLRERRNVGGMKEKLPNKEALALQMSLLLAIDIQRSEVYVILQSKKQLYEKQKKHLNKRRECFLHDTDSVSVHERQVLHDHYYKELQMIRGKMCEVVGQQNAENTVRGARQTQVARTPMLQGCTHGSLAAGLSDEKVRMGMCRVISRALCANASAHIAQWEASQVYAACI